MLVRTGYGRLHYDLIGEAEAPVVCMLHSLTSDGGMWAEQVPMLLDAGYQVLRPDMRGHGGSSPAPGEYRVEELAAELVVMLDSLGFASVHLVGLSIGGMIGQALAAAYPERLASLMACATTARWEGDSAMMHRRLAAVQASGTLETIVDEAMEQRYSPAVRATRPLRWQALRESFLGTSLDGYFGCMHAVLNHDVSQALPFVRVSTLVVAGSDDPVTPPAANRRIAEAVPGARYEEIAGGRHFLNVEFAEEFNQLLKSWLATASNRAGLERQAI